MATEYSHSSKQKLDIYYIVVSTAEVGKADWNGLQENTEAAHGTEAGDAAGTASVYFEAMERPFGR